MLWVVRKRNPFWPPGTYVRRFDQGWQRVKMETIKVPHPTNPRLPPSLRVEDKGCYGILLPYAALAPFASRVLRQGLDK